MLYFGLKHPLVFKCQNNMATAYHGFNTNFVVSFILCTYVFKIFYLKKKKSKTKTVSCGDLCLM